MSKEITAWFGKERSMDNNNNRGKEKIFIKLMTDFRERQLKELKGAPLSVFLCLALHSNDEGECFVSNNIIAKETGYSVNSIKKAKRFLVEKEYLYFKEERWTKELIKKRFSNNIEKQKKLIENKLGSFASNTYMIFPPNNKIKEQKSKKNHRGTEITPRSNRGTKITPGQKVAHKEEPKRSLEEEPYKLEEEEVKNQQKLSTEIKSKYQSIFNRKLSIQFEKEILSICSDENIIKYCLSLAEKKADKPSWIITTLKDWENNKLTNVQEIEKYLDDRSHKKNANKKSKSNKDIKIKLTKEDQKTIDDIYRKAKLKSNSLYKDKQMTIKIFKLFKNIVEDNDLIKKAMNFADNEMRDYEMIKNNVDSYIYYAKGYR